MKKWLFILLLLILPAKVSGQHTVNGNYAHTGSGSTQGNTCREGGKRWIDVTCPPYNADPTGMATSNAAIQGAIMAACATPPSSAYGSRTAIYFPAGIYSVDQPQTPSTAPIFSIPCGGLLFLGGGSLRAGNEGTPQFGQAGAGAAIQVFRSGGASPNDAAIFGCVSHTQITFRNLDIEGWNQAVSGYNCSQLSVPDSILGVLGHTGHTDNAPLVVYNSIWVRATNTTFFTLNGGDYCAIFGGNIPVAGESALAGDVTIEGSVSSCGGFEYIQRVANTNSTGSYTFDKFKLENSLNPLFTVNESIPGLLNVRFGFVTVKDSELQDAGSNLPLLVSNTLSGGFTGVSLISSAGTSPTVVRSASTGDLRQSVNSLAQAALYGFADQNGNPIYTSNSSSGGLNQIVTNGGSNGVVTCSAYISQCGNDSNHDSVPGYSFFKAGTLLATLGLDAHEGLLWASGTVHGFEMGMRSDSEGTVDITAAKYLPPTNPSGTATTGGALSAATYYGTLWAYDGVSCVTTSSHSAFAYIPGVVVGGANNAITFNWTGPATSPSVPSGYCLQVVTTAPIEADSSATQALTISGGGTTSFLYTGQPQTNIGLADPTSYMTPVHRFTATSLGVGTTGPQATLDVAGGMRCALATKSMAYTLASTDCIVDVTGTTTITAPRALSGVVWRVFNSGSNTVTIKADSGNINGGANVTRSANTGYQVWCDGTNCFAQ